MYCNKCGFKNEETTKFCTKCGNLLGVSNPPTNSTIQENNMANQTNSVNDFNAGMSKENNAVSQTNPADELYNANIAKENNSFNQTQMGNNISNIEASKNYDSFNSKTDDNRIKFVIAAIAVVVLILGVILFINFKPKTLKCTISEESSGMIIENNITFNYIGKKMKSSGFEMKIDLGDYKDYKDEMLEIINSKFKDSLDEINEDGGKASISDTDDSIIVKAHAKRDNISTLLSIDEDAESYSYEKMKEEFESDGYTCK